MPLMSFINRGLWVEDRCSLKQDVHCYLVFPSQTSSLLSTVEYSLQLGCLFSKQHCIRYNAVKRCSAGPTVCHFLQTQERNTALVQVRILVLVLQPRNCCSPTPKNVNLMAFTVCCGSLAFPRHALRWIYSQMFEHGLLLVPLVFRVFLTQIISMFFPGFFSPEKLS